jgi:hypothetical protein
LRSDLGYARGDDRRAERDLQGLDPKQPVMQRYGTLEAADRQFCQARSEFRAYAEPTRCMGLAAKLNLAAAAATGEPLAAAFLYGGTATVATAVAGADDILARACPGLVCDHELGCGTTGPTPCHPARGAATRLPMPSSLRR